VVLFTICFLIGIPLLARSLSESKYGVVLGAVSAWLLLPINNLSSYLMPFPTTQAIFFATLVLFGVLAYVRRGDGDDAMALGSPFGVLLTILVAGILLVHPQQTVNIVVLLGAFGGSTPTTSSPTTGRCTASSESPPSCSRSGSPPDRASRRPSRGCPTDCSTGCSTAGSTARPPRAGRR
jgi:hypothetical protein